MKMFQFLKSIQRGLQESALPLAFASAAVAAFSAIAIAEEAIVTNVGRFEIPFDMEAEPGQRPEGFAVLFGSQDGGRTWEKVSTVPAASESFTFTAPRDGQYSFAIRTTDAQGNLQQAIQGSKPELEVVVDTVAPDIQLNLQDGGNGQVLVNWVIKDASVSAHTLNIEVADSTDGRWKPVRFVPAVNGQAAIQTTGSSAVSVRAAVMDQAGNHGEASAQLMVRSNGSKPNTIPTNPYSQSNAPALGPTPFPGINTGADSFPDPSGLSLPFNSAVSNAAGSISPNTSFPNNDIPAVPQNSSQETYSTNPATSHDPYGTGMMKEASYQPGSGAQVIKNHVFDLEYQVDDVGPSGVSAVELFVSEDGGKHWFTYGNDEDLRSPVLIDTRGEGTFGFAVRVRNGLGFADDPPQPGQAPEMVVTVDETVPVIELAQPTMRSDGFGTIQLSWQVRDKNPASTPVRLEYSSASNGPWTPVFDWQYDQSTYQWGVRPGTPTQLYFRLLARDAAGNVAAAQTPQPVVVDLRRPVGRLLRVQAVSQPGNQN